jgi:hypothetical protein
MIEIAIYVSGFYGLTWLVVYVTNYGKKTRKVHFDDPSAPKGYQKWSRAIKLGETIYEEVSLRAGIRSRNKVHRKKS